MSSLTKAQRERLWTPANATELPLAMRRVLAAAARGVETDIFEDPRRYTRKEIDEMIDYQHQMVDAWVYGRHG